MAKGTPIPTVRKYLCPILVGFLISQYLHMDAVGYILIYFTSSARGSRCDFSSLAPVKQAEKFPDVFLGSKGDAEPQMGFHWDFCHQMETLNSSNVTFGVQKAFQVPQMNRKRLCFMYFCLSYLFPRLGNWVIYFISACLCITMGPDISLHTASASPCVWRTMWKGAL